MPDINAHIDEIAAATDVNLDPLLLEEVSDRLKSCDNSSTVVFTSLFHFREVDDILKGLGSGVNVIGVHTGPNEQTLQRIASIASGAKVGVVANNPDGSARINKLVTTYANVETTVLSSPTDEELLALADNIDVLVCTRDQEQLIRRLDLPVPLITLPFHVSQNSATRVLEAMLDKGDQEEGAMGSLRE